MQCKNTVGMCGMDFSSSVRFEKNCGFGYGLVLKNRRLGSVFFVDQL